MAEFKAEGGTMRSSRTAKVAVNLAMAVLNLGMASQTYLDYPLIAAFSLFVAGWCAAFAVAIAWD